MWYGRCHVRRYPRPRRPSVATVMAFSARIRRRARIHHQIRAVTIAPAADSVAAAAATAITAAVTPITTAARAGIWAGPI